MDMSNFYIVIIFFVFIQFILAYIALYNKYTSFVKNLVLIPIFIIIGFLELEYINGSGFISFTSWLPYVILLFLFIVFAQTLFNVIVFLYKKSKNEIIEKYSIIMIINKLSIVVLVVWYIILLTNRNDYVLYNFYYMIFFAFYHFITTIIKIVKIIDIYEKEKNKKRLSQ